MKNNPHLFLKLSGIVLSAMIVFTACGPSLEEIKTREKAMADSVSVTAPATAKTETGFHPDSSRVFVRTADLYFKVKDVKLATFDIERIINENNGYVTSSKLESTINGRNSVRVTKDSLKETISYNVHNDMILRVPTDKLDKTLSEIAVLMEYLDHRRLSAEDVTKDFQLSALSQSNFKNHKQRVEKVIEEKGKKLTSTVEAENELFDKQSMANQMTIDTKEIAHDVAYSTVQVSIYQNENTKSEMLLFSETPKPYEPPFSEKLLNAMSTGGVILQEILLFFIKLWPLWLLALGCIFVFRKIARLKWFN